MICMYCDDKIGGGHGGWYSLTTGFEICSRSPTTFHEGAGDPWVWNARQRAFTLPRSLRLPKRPRRMARQKLREDA